MTSTRTIRRLRTAVIFAAARGAATAFGSGLAGLALWWLMHYAAHLLACQQAACQAVALKYGL